MYKVLWFTRLRPGVSADRYKRFVQEVDYPAVARIPSISRYTSVHVQGPATGNGELSYDFVDIAEVEDVDAYRRDLEEHPAALEVHGRSGEYVEVVGTLLVELVEPA
jgi:hypothetical protein